MPSNSCQSVRVELRALATTKPSMETTNVRSAVDREHGPDRPDPSHLPASEAQTGLHETQIPKQVGTRIRRTAEEDAPQSNYCPPSLTESTESFGPPNLCSVSIRTRQTVTRSESTASSIPCEPTGTERAMGFSPMSMRARRVVNAPLNGYKVGANLRIERNSTKSSNMPCAPSLADGDARNGAS